MLKKVNNIRLLAFLVLLILAYAGVKLFKNTSRSRAFREDLVEIDSSRVTKMVISKPGESFEVVEEDGDWKVIINENKKVPAMARSVQNAMGTLMTIEPDRIATRDPEKWRDYQVDTAGTRVQVYEGDKRTLDLIIGRFGVQQGRQQQFGMQGRQQFHTFVRLKEDDEVYAADDFMGMSFPSEPSSFRNTRFVELETDSIAQITFDYPADSSFILSKQGMDWYIGPSPADSASVADYLSGLSYISSKEFVDDVEPASMINPLFKVNVEQTDGHTVQMEAYRHPAHNYVLHSSYNPESYFSDEKLIDRVFVGMETLLNPPEE